MSKEKARSLSRRRATCEEPNIDSSFFLHETLQQTPHETILQFCARKKPRGKGGKPLLPIFQLKSDKKPEITSHRRFKTQQEARKIACAEQ
jgi:hypothetical protein